MKYSKEVIEQHIKTHSERSADDNDAVAFLESSLRSDGKINTNFTKGDKWPNIDGTFELVPNPSISRRPTQNFFVQIKGTNSYELEKDGSLKYQLQSLAFPAYIYNEVTADPGILFVVLNPSKRGQEHIFWKYMSQKIINSIDFTQSSKTIEFKPEDELFNTDESINDFVEKLIQISSVHSFSSKLENIEYTKNNIFDIINLCDQQISESIDKIDLFNESRDSISKRMLTRLWDLCSATLLLNAHDKKYEYPTLRLAWETSLMDINTKFLSSFMQSLNYIGKRIPEDGQSERLMMKYYDYLWQIRNYLKKDHNTEILKNLEKFPRNIDNENENYYSLIGDAIKSASTHKIEANKLRYYIVKKTTFYVDKDRYFEITLQLAGKYASKYNRITVYSKVDISTNYSIQIKYSEADVNIWDEISKIKIITDWKVSIDPATLNKLSKILNNEIRISAKYGEYDSLMEFFTKTGMNMLDLIDLRQETFEKVIHKIYNSKKTSHFKQILIKLKENFNDKSETNGRNTIRYILLDLKEEALDDVIPELLDKKMDYTPLSLISGCIPFEKKTFLYNLPGRKNSKNDSLKNILRAVGTKRFEKQLPYIRLKKLIESSGNIYIPKAKIILENEENKISEYNNSLTPWDKNKGQEIKYEGEFLYIDEYEKNTLYILKKLIQFTKKGNEGQQQLNNKFMENNKSLFCEDPSKKEALKKAFVNSKIIMIYGAAGTGKTTLMNYLSTLMKDSRKLFLTMTRTALDNLQRRITYTSTEDNFMSVDRFINNNETADYDIIFVDECSTIDNRTMTLLLEKVTERSLLVLAGDIYQIESIDFGNWFFYSKNIISQNSLVELTNTWRTKDSNIQSLWEEVRNKGTLTTEKLVIDGPFSENITKSLFNKSGDDEIVLCLNYDGRFGLNNINSYFQDLNPNKEVYYWHDWKYKIGDPILFNETKRFPKLHNNLKGKIADIFTGENYITFKIDIEANFTFLDTWSNDFKITDIQDNFTQIQFTVHENEGGSTDEEREKSKMNSIVPFQIAYAVSIHKAQGLEYDTVKIVIPNSNSEKITHGIFYTAITRAKKTLKIYWSSETMNKVISEIKKDDDETLCLNIIKNKLTNNN